VGKTEVAGVTVRDAVDGVPAVWRRIASAVVLIPTFVWVTAGAPAWMFQMLVVAASGLACAELVRMFQRSGRPIHTWLTVGMGGALTASFATSLYAVARDDGRTLRWMPTPEVVLVVGVGLNVSWPPDDEAIRDVSDSAVALNWVTSVPIDRVDLLVAFLRRLDRSYGQLVSGGPQTAMDEWRRRSATLGRRVRVDLGPDDVEGTAVDVTAEGHLVVEALGGGRRTFAVGDVIHLTGA